MHTARHTLGRQLVPALAALLVWLTLGTGVASAATITFQPPEADASLDQNSPNVNYGAAPLLRVISWGPTSNWRTLVHFDLSMLPAGLYITKATLLLCLDDIATSKSTRLYGVHRVTTPWEEEEVTANQAVIGLPWNFGDYEFIATDTVALRPSTLRHNPHRFISWDVTVDVRAYLDDGVPNHGWLVKDRNEDKATSYRTTWVSKEATTSVCGGAPPASSPKLVIVTE